MKQEQTRFEQVVLPHLDAAHNLARWLVRDAVLADDVVQEAALSAFRYFASYRGGDARAWLLQIVRNAALAALASRQRRTAVSLDEAGAEPWLQIADVADDPEMALAGRQRAARLEHALGALPIELRECIVLRELEELSYKQIAQVTGMPIGTVMSRLWRARKMLVRCGAGGELA